MADLNQQEVQQLMQSFAQLSNSFQHGQRGVGDYADAQRQAANEIQSSFNNAAQQIRGAAIDYTKAMFSATEGTGKYAGAVSAAGSAAWEVGKNFGVLGIAAGGLIKVFGEVAAASLRQNDVLMKAYRDFADAGDLSGSLDEVISNLHRVGLTSDQAASFGKILDDIAPTLVAFGGGVSTGLQKYVEAIDGMIGRNSELEVRMGKLGYNVQGMREATAGYMMMQSKLGLSQKMTVQDIQQGSEMYMTTLRELQELTGLSRDAAAKALQQQLMDYNWAVYIADLKKQDPTGKKADDAMKLMQVNMEKLGKDAFPGMVSLIINQGRIVDQAGAEIYNATNGQLIPAFNAVNDGSKTVEEGFGQIVKGVRQVSNANAENIKVLGDQGRAVYGSNQMRLGALEYESTVLGNSAKMVSGQMNKYDANFKKNLLLEQNGRDRAIAADAALYGAHDGMIDIMSGLNYVMQKFAKLLATMIDTFGPYVGLKKTNLAAQFKDPDDLKDDLANARKQKERLEAEINALKNQPLPTTNSEYDKLIQQKETERYAKDNEIARLRSSNEAGNVEKIKNLEREAANITATTENLKKERDSLKRQDGTIDADEARNKRQRKIDALEQQKAQIESQMARDNKKLNATSNDLGSDSRKGTNFERGKTVDWDVDNSGQKISENSDAFKGRKQAQAEITTRGQGIKEGGKSAANDILGQLNFGTTDQRAERVGEPTPELLALAERLKKFGIPGTFTAMNDEWHKTNKPNSRHNKGKAFDFALDNPPKTPEEAASLKWQFKDLGATKVLDEYFTDKQAGEDPANSSGHFHLEVARQGGLFSGPDDGFPVMLHGKNESVWNEKQMHTLLEDVKKSSVDNYKQELMDQMGLNKPVTAPISTSSGNDNEVVMSMIALLSDKFDALISISNQTKNIQDDLLTYART